MKKFTRGGRCKKPGPLACEPDNSRKDNPLSEKQADPQSRIPRTGHPHPDTVSFSEMKAAPFSAGPRGPDGPGLAVMGQSL